MTDKIQNPDSNTELPIAANAEQNLDSEAPEKLSIFQLTHSVLAAAFGVQSSKNRKRDFSQKSFTPFIIGGIVFTAVFVITVASVVSLVLRAAG